MNHESGAGAGVLLDNPALAWFSAASPLLSKALGGPAGPSRAISGGYVIFDNSGFTVATGRARAQASSNSLWWAAVSALGILGLIVWAKKN